MEVAEFDQFADEYYQLHAQNISASGETPEFFAEYKIVDTARIAARHNLTSSITRLLDFGSGTGNSIPYFRQYWPRATVTCADVSTRCMEVSKQRFPGNETYALIDNNKLPCPDNSQDMVFSACVFHHIPHREHEMWLTELRRVLRPGGLLAIFEHNPYNPLTMRAVRDCPFDCNAELIRTPDFRKRAMAAGYKNIVIDYRIFFPKFLSFLRPVEGYIRWLPLGAQYCLTARK